MLERFNVLLRYIKGPFKTAIKGGLKCGENVTVMGGCNFGSEPYLITLADNVRISNKVTFITHDGGNFSFRHLDKYKDVNHFGKIVVDEYTFIGANSIIMPGVHIGKNCVIGAGALVTKSVPDSSVVAGIPAKIICTTDEYAEKMKSRMPKEWDVNAYKADKRRYLEDIIPSPEKIEKRHGKCL